MKFLPSAVPCPPSPFLWLLAFICALYPLNDYQVELLGAGAVLVLFWSYGRISGAVKKDISPLSGRWLPGIMLAFLIVLFARSVTSGVPWVSFIAFFFMASMPLTFITLARHPFDAREWRTLIGGLGIVAGLLAIWAMIQFFVFYDYFDGRAAHPLADPNSLAALFNLAAICALGVMMHAGCTRRERLAGFMLALLLAGGVIATGSRGGLLFLIGGGVLLAIFCARFAWRARRAWLAFIIGAGLLVAASALSHSPQLITNRLAFSAGLRAGEAEGDRVTTLRGAAALIKDHWLMGTGTGTFYLYYPAYRLPAQNDLVTHAHSDPLQLWAEAGILAPLLFYAFILTAIVVTVRRVRTLPPDDARRLSILVPFTALGVLVAHSHMNFNLYNFSILMLAAAVMAFWQAQVAKRVCHQPGHRSNSPRRVTAKQGALAVLYGLPILVCSLMVASEHEAARARDAMFSGRLDVYGHHMLRADALGLHANPNVYMLAVNMPMALLQQRLPELSDEEIAQEANQINNNLDAALARNPRLGAAWYFKGFLRQLVPGEALPETLKDSRFYYERALAINPMHVGARVALIDQAMDEVRTKEALALARAGVPLRYTTPAARDFYMRALPLFTVNQDVDWLIKAQKALLQFEARAQKSQRRRDEGLFMENPAPRPAESFPQDLDSKEQ